MKRSVLIAILLLIKSSINSQNIELKWSDQFIYDNKIDGFFDGFLGANANIIYAKFSNLALKPSKQNNKIKLLAFDKTTMKKIGEVELAGFKKEIDKDQKYYKTIILENVIYVVWTKEKKGIVEVFVQSFDSKLKKLNKLSKVYELVHTKDISDNLFILSNKDIDNKILIAKELGISKDEDDLKLEYKLLNSDFTLDVSHQVTLPLIVTKKRRGLFRSGSSSFDSPICGYELGNDGNLYAQKMIRLSDEEKKNLKRKESDVYPHFMQVNLASGDIREYKLKFPMKNTFDPSMLVTKNGVKLYGFFSDLEKDTKGKDSHGLFYISLSSSNFKVKEEKFTYFEKSFLDELYSDDKENQKKGKGLFKSKRAKDSDNESLDNNYVIEQVISDGSDILLFCTIMNNWQRTTCTTNSNGSTSCRTDYFCTKSNVTAFKLNSDGKLIWAKNMDRSITYSGWYINDLSVVRKENNYYVTYGSAFEINAKKKNRRSAKSSKEMDDRLEYAIFSGDNGNYKKEEYAVNSLSTKKKTAKSVTPKDIYVIDNKMFIACSRYKLKPATYIACLCPPVFYAMLLNGNSKKGTGYLGTINPLK